MPISRGISALLPVDELLARALASAMKFMNADRGFIVLRSEDGSLVLLDVNGRGPGGSWNSVGKARRRVDARGRAVRLGRWQPSSRPRTMRSILPFSSKIICVSTESKSMAPRLAPSL